jgi:hypothetical protein
MMSVLFEVVPRLTALLVAAGAVAVVELAVLLLAGRALGRQEALRKRLLAGQGGDGAPRFSRAFELVAALAPLAVVGLTVAAIQTCRHMILQGLSDPGQPDNAALMGRGMSGEMHAVMIGLLLTMSVTALAGLAVALAVSARLRGQGLARALTLAPGSPEAAAWARYPGPAAGRLVAVIGAFLVLGLGPVLATSFRSGRQRITTFASLGGFEPGQRFELLNQNLEAVAAELKLGLWAGRIGLVVAAALAVKLLVLDAPSRMRARALGRAEEQGRGQAVLAILFAVLAAAAFVVALPLQRENALPWPPLSKDSGGPRAQVDTPELTGPDELERGPVLVVTPANTRLDGRVLDAARLEEVLWVLRDNDRVLHPGALFNRRLVFLCAKDTSRARIDPALAAARRAGYERPLFTFVRREVTERPLFGPRRRMLTTTVAFNLVAASDQAEEGSAVVDTYEACADLGARLVGLRGQGRSVAVVVQ